LIIERNQKVSKKNSAYLLPPRADKLTKNKRIARNKNLTVNTTIPASRSQQNSAVVKLNESKEFKIRVHL